MNSQQASTYVPNAFTQLTVYGQKNGWSIDVCIMLAVAHLANLRPHSFVGTPADIADRCRALELSTGIPYIVQEGCCRMIDADENTLLSHGLFDFTSFPEYLDEVVRAGAASTAKPAAVTSPVPAFPAGTKHEADTASFEKAIQLDPGWVKRAEPYLAMTAMCERYKRGERIDCQVFPGVATNQKTQLCVELINSDPRPVIDTYLECEGTILATAPPCFNLNSPIRLRHGNDVYVIHR